MFIHQLLCRALLAIPHWLSSSPMTSNDDQQQLTSPALVKSAEPDVPDAHIVSNETWQYVDQIRERWGIPGLSVAVVAGDRARHERLLRPDRKSGSDHEWTQEVRGFGVANSAGEPVTRDVSGQAACEEVLQLACLGHHIRRMLRPLKQRDLTDARRSSPSRPTRSSSPR